MKKYRVRLAGLGLYGGCLGRRARLEVSSFWKSVLVRNHPIPTVENLDMAMLGGSCSWVGSLVCLQKARLQTQPQGLGIVICLQAEGEVGLSGLW